jgi:hypothetical protein
MITPLSRGDDLVEKIAFLQEVHIPRALCVEDAEVMHETKVNEWPQHLVREHIVLLPTAAACWLKINRQVVASISLRRHVEDVYGFHVGCGHTKRKHLPVRIAVHVWQEANRYV